LSNSTEKKSLRVDFDKYVDNQTLYGLEELILNCNFGDPSYIREALAYSFFEKAGLPAGKFGFAEVFINSEYIGLYTIVENVDKQYLERNFLNSDGDFFKAKEGGPDLVYSGDDGNRYLDDLEMRQGDSASLDRLVEFIRILNSDVDQKYKDQLSEILNISETLDHFAIDFVISNMDSYIINGNNFFLYYDTRQKKYRILPWDLNESFGYFGSGGENSIWNVYDTTKGEYMEFAPSVSANSSLSSSSNQTRNRMNKPLFDQLYKMDEFKEYYLEKVEYYTRNILDSEEFMSQIDTMFALIKDSVLEEPEQSKEFTSETFLKSIEKDIAKSYSIVDIESSSDTSEVEERNVLNEMVEENTQNIATPITHGIKPFIQKRTKEILNQLENKQ
jgi:spore coat protein CotH